MKKLLILFLLVAVGISSCSQRQMHSTPEQDTLMARIKNMYMVPSPLGVGYTGRPSPDMKYVHDLKTLYSEKELCEMAVRGDNGNLRLMAFLALCLTDIDRAIDVVCNDIDANDNDSARYCAGCIIERVRVSDVFPGLADYYYYEKYSKCSDKLREWRKALRKER